MNRIALLAGLLFLIVAFAGCPSTKQTQKAEPPPAADSVKPAMPEIVLTIASIDLSKHKKKMDAKDISQLSGLLKKEKIDIVAVQEITRYPSLPARVDFVDELARVGELRHVFGEMISSSGSQIGNAVFSVYPIRSSDNVAYKGLKSLKFEKALVAVIDGGVRDIVVVSTEIPEKASSEEMSSCMKTLAGMRESFANQPLIVAGRLPSSRVFRSLGKFEDAFALAPLASPPTPPSRFWYADGESLKPLSARVVESPFGALTILEVGVFRAPRP